MNTGPIFIGGLSHSGKTFLRLMLSSHPNLVITRKTYMWTRFYGRYGDLVIPENFEACLAAMLRIKHIRFLNPDPDRIRREFKKGQPTYARLFALFHEHYAEQVGKPRWGDQLGFVERYAEAIFSAYPAAKMIHMVRDPRQRYVESKIGSSAKKGKTGWETARWLRSVKLAAHNQQLFPRSYKIVRYEDLTNHTEETIRMICSFLDEDFSPAMLTMEGALRYPEETYEEGNRKRKIKTQAAGADRFYYQEISKSELAFLQTRTKDEMKLYGYPLEPIHFSPKEWVVYSFLDLPANLVGMGAWYTSEVRQPSVTS